MTVISAYAYSSRDQQVATERSRRIANLIHLRDSMRVHIERGYITNTFTGLLPTPEHKSLSPIEVAMVATNDTFCFGGSCEVHQHNFTGRLNID